MTLNKSFLDFSFSIPHSNIYLVILVLLKQIQYHYNLEK
jgi:hypothetical protein